MKKTFKHYENILKELKEYEKANLSELNFEEDINNIEKILNSQKFTIAVVANMSAGKSTFINALFGDDILPALEKATTDCATYIKSNNDCNDNQAVVHFIDSKREKVVIPKNEVKKEIKYFAVKDSAEITDRYRGVSEIILEWDFLNIRTDSHNKIEVIFIDTPGPNNTEKEFSEKHKNQTAKLINEVDMVLYLFDYSQVDACLQGDEQGIWRKIQSRNENDKNFKVFFVINKIDVSLINLFAQTKSLDKELRKITRQEQWAKEKELAVSKISSAAKSHGFKNPEIYAVASELALWDRQNNNNILDEDHEDKFENSKKEIQRVWDGSWENKFHELIGFNKIEMDINSFIEKSLEEKVLSKIHGSINTIIEEKKNIIYTQTTIRQQTEEEAKKNLNNAQIILSKEMPIIKKEFNKLMDNKKLNIYSDIDSNLKDEYENSFSHERIGVIVQKSISFLSELAQGSDLLHAKHSARIPANYEIISIEKASGMEQDSKYTKEELFSYMDSFCGTLIKDEFRDFKSRSKNKIYTTYKKFKDELNYEYKKSKYSLQEKINETLYIKLPSIDSKISSIDIKSETLNIKFDRTLIDVTENYGFLNIGKVSKFFNSKLFNSKEIKFDVLKFYNDLEMNLELQVSILIDEETNNHKDKINQFIELYTDLFKDFEDKKNTEIDELRENFSKSKDKHDNSKDNLNKLNLILGKLNGK